MPSVKFQTIDIEFPETLYVLALWLDLGLRTPFFLQEVYTDLTVLGKNASESINELKNRVENKEKVLEEHVLVMEVVLAKKHPLLESMWEEPVVEFDQINRNVQFIYAMDKPDFYKVAVTPVLADRKVERYFAAFAYPVSEEDNLETLMRSSNIHVSPEAKDAGIYKIKDTFGYELATGKKIDNEKETFVS